MGIGFKILIGLINFWKFFGAALAFMYLLLWLLQFFAEGLFALLDKLFGFLPNIFNDLIPVEADLFGKDAPMGYVYSALVVVLSAWGAKKAYKKLDSIRRMKENEELERRIKKQKALRKQKEQKQRAEKIKTMDTFYGLYELKLEYIDGFTRPKEELVKLKCEYSKMIVKKIKEKYSKISFALSDKIFFTSDNFNIFSPLVGDLIKLYKIFFDMDMQKCIQTELLLSFWTTYKVVNPKAALKILLKINALKYTDKVIVSKEIYNRYQQEPVRSFDFFPLGASKLDKAGEAGQDVDIELFYIKSTH